MLLAPASVTALTARGAEGDGDGGPGLLEEHMEQVPEPTEMSRGCQGSAGMPGNRGGETTRGAQSMRCESRLHKLELIRQRLSLTWFGRALPGGQPVVGAGRGSFSMGSSSKLLRRQIPAAVAEPGRSERGSFVPLAQPNALQAPLPCPRTEQRCPPARPSTEMN